MFASAETHRLLADFRSRTASSWSLGVPLTAGPFRLTAFPVVHSVRCPCVAARIETPDGVVVYSGDVVSFETAAAADEALADARVYVGDGSTLTGSLVRRHPSGALVGHTTVRAQLGWLAKAAVPRAIFSHFGEEPIAMGYRALGKALKELAAAKAPDCRVEAARDGKGVPFRLSWTLLPRRRVRLCPLAARSGEAVRVHRLRGAGLRTPSSWQGIRWARSDWSRSARPSSSPGIHWD